MIQQIVELINSLDPFYIYLVLFIFPFIENLLPPAPGDIIVVIAATLIAQDGFNFFSILLITTIGSSLGFFVMYLIGEFFGDRIIRKGKLKFIKQEYLNKVDHWFHKYGFNVILVNRFLPGTRAVISFFCGVHKVPLVRSFLTASLSSLLWNAVLISLGVFLGKNINVVDNLLSDYSRVIGIVTAVIVVVVIFKIWHKRKKSK